MNVRWAEGQGGGGVDGEGLLLELSTGLRDLLTAVSGHCEISRGPVDSSACWCWVALLHQPITGAELVMLEQVAGISVELEQDWITNNVTISVRIGKKCLNINGVNKILYSLSLVFDRYFHT